MNFSFKVTFTFSFILLVVLSSHGQSFSLSTFTGFNKFSGINKTTNSVKDVTKDFDYSKRIGFNFQTNLNLTKNFDLCFAYSQEQINFSYEWDNKRDYSNTYIIYENNQNTMVTDNVVDGKLNFELIKHSLSLGLDYSIKLKNPNFECSFGIHWVNSVIKSNDIFFKVSKQEYKENNTKIKYVGIYIGEMEMALNDIRFKTNLTYTVTDHFGLIFYAQLETFGLVNRIRHSKSDAYHEYHDDQLINSRYRYNTFSHYLSLYSFEMGISYTIN